MKVSDGFAVLRARVGTISRQFHVPAGFVLYFKTSRRQVQSNFQEMTANNFEDFLTSRWAKITTQEVAKWTEDGLNAHEFPVFEFFVYAPAPNQQQTQQENRIQRATQRRIAEARRRLQQHDNQNSIERGAIERDHLAIVNARRPEGNELELPHDNTTLQARRLDQLRQELQNEDEQAAAARNAVFQPVTIKLNGVELEVEMNVSSLWSALGLPSYNMFHQGLVGNYNHEQVQDDEDVEDIDHVEPQPGAVGNN